MSIPEGYRLLTANDVGKVFGVDLELDVYIDGSVTPIDSIFVNNTTINLTNFIHTTKTYDEMGYEAYVPQIFLNDDGIFQFATWFDFNNPFTMPSDLSVSSYNTDIEGWNNFFYVKDKPDPYNIKLTEPKLTIHCEGATMEKEIVVQADVYDGTVEGGEVESGGGAKNFTLTIETEYADAATISSIQYSVDGNDLVDTGITTAPYGPVTYNLKGSSILIAIKGSGGVYERSVEITSGKLIPFYSNYTYAYNNFCYYCVIEEENASINIVLYTD